MQIWGQATQNLPQFQLTIDDKGDIMTNLHVIRTTDRWVVTFWDGSKSDATATTIASMPGMPRHSSPTRPGPRQSRHSRRRHRPRPHRPRPLHPFKSARWVR